MQLRSHRIARLLVDEAEGVTVAHLTIDGSDADSGSGFFPSCFGLPFYTGIYYRNSSGTVETAHVTNLMSADHCTFGIFVQTDQNGARAANVVVKKNLVDHYGVGGINCAGQTTACVVTENTIRGEGPVDDLLQVGIFIRAEASGAISGNRIMDHFRLGARGVPGSATGIFLSSATPSSNPHLIQDNIFAGNQLDVQRFGIAAAFD